MKHLLFYIFLLSATSTVLGQQIQVTGGFIEDTTKIGEPIHYYLKAEYPSHFEVIFPDSNFNFEPYEFLSKYYAPQQIDSALVRDSAVFELLTFEIERWQKLQLPVFMLQDKDSLQMDASADSIYVSQLVGQVSDTTSLIANVDYNEVDTQFNYPIIYIVGFALLALVVLFLVIFGRRIGKRITLGRLRRDYERFTNSFDQVMADIRKDNTPERAEQGINLWKRYLEKLERKPYTRLTTKELITFGVDELIVPPLKNIDRSVYGRLVVDNIHQDFEKLEDYTLNIYRKKLEEVRNG